jgi:hypothetical protein
MVATDVVSPAALTACEQEDLALVDRRGTLLLRAPNVFIKVQGTLAVKRRSRVPVFHGKGARLVRVLLGQGTEARTVVTLASLTETAYAYAHGVVAQLEQEGFLERASKRGGFRVRNAPGLLRAWMESGAKTGLAVEAFNAPSTSPHSLARASDTLTQQGIRTIFTLASGLTPDERYVSGLPHGLYLSGALEPVVEALQLRRMTPHNFFILRPEPAADTAAGGVYFAPRALEVGPAVALPQLAVDLHGLGGRALEQATVLLEQYAKALPFAIGAP